MRLNLDDNERGAFHYLLGGVVVVVLLKTVAFITDRLGPSLSPEQLALHPFQQGYPMLRGELITVGTSTGLTERLVMAVVFSVGITFLFAFVLTAILRWRSEWLGRTGMLITRAVLLVTLAWSVWSAFLLPIQEAEVASGQLILKERRAAIGDIPWPFTLHEVRIPGHDVVRLEAGSTSPHQECDGADWIDAVTAEGRHRIGSVNGVCASEEMNELQRASDGAAILERELR